METVVVKTREMKVAEGNMCGTLTTDSCTSASHNGSYGVVETVKIKQATKEGYIECKIGGWQTSVSLAPLHEEEEYRKVEMCVLRLLQRKLEFVGLRKQKWLMLTAAICFKLKILVVGKCKKEK